MSRLPASAVISKDGGGGGGGGFGVFDMRPPNRLGLFLFSLTRFCLAKDLLYCTIFSSEAFIALKLAEEIFLVCIKIMNAVTLAAATPQALHH
ncbi:anaphase-promoting complex subunit 5 isoform X1 [Iris pallida]|uniref:Anaphase-promoting complex subunit 5 isoform X1 n=1 Tax=Iris pallida TaxID=29817 RepID=A0AAX6HC76_IRIPA|nr:anaphase-promoting complex subunit 5 isoform X1 [Iris pallida]KAJ6838362.1 anaphase-promoting complex subunit 5 isoform X1 [Iris pallida]